MRQFRSDLLPAASVMVVLASLYAIPAGAVPFTPTNLVSDDQAAHAAQITDPGLKNAWGLSYTPSGPFWIAANGSGTSPIYNVNPADQTTTKQALTVSIPGGGVTGQVFNPNTSSFNGNLFLFVSENGSVSGWQPSFVRPRGLLLRHQPITYTRAQPSVMSREMTIFTQPTSNPAR